MSTYRVAPNHNISLGALIVLSPQPRSAGLQYVRKTPVADGSIVTEGPYVELVWDVLESVSVYQDILADFGLGASQSANVTVYIRNEVFDWSRMNGRAIRPPANWQNYYPRQIVILVKNLETAA